MNSLTDIRTRPPADDSRPGPAGPVQPPSEWEPAGERREPDTGSRSERLCRLRQQIRSGAYDPPLEEVAERMAAFFVIDRRYLPADINES
jgi:hypothetical protein